MANADDMTSSGQTPADTTPVGQGSTNKVRVWDLPTRIFHWALAGAILFSWASYEFSELLANPSLSYHRYSGYVVIILVTWRLLWGIAGPTNARFSNFLRGPKTVLGYAGALFTGRDRPYLGHNPLGAYGVLLLLAFAGFQATLGLMSEEHNFTMWGPLSHLPDQATKEWITELHSEFFYSALLVLIGIHVASGLFHVVFKREPLIKAMVTGDKPALHDYADMSDGTAAAQKGALGTNLRALILLAISAGLFYAVIIALGGKVFY